MGARSSKTFLDDSEDDTKEYGVYQAQREMQRRIKVPLQVMVAHYTPSSFPLIPVVDVGNATLCRDSWKKIVSTDIKDPYGGPSMSGITAFYNEFYERLEQYDNNGKFDAVLSRHSGGQNKIAAKGAILIRIIDFVLKIQEDNKKNEFTLLMLGKSHAQKSIRPWQYSIFVQTLLNTIASRLGVDASNNVMVAWVNLFAYVMQGMLPAAIKGHVVETELNINTSSEFASGQVAEQVKEIEEEKDLKRKFGAGSTGSLSRGPSTGRSNL